MAGAAGSVETTALMVWSRPGEIESADLLELGDVVEVEIEALGIAGNPVIDENRYRRNRLLLAATGGTVSGAKRTRNRERKRRNLCKRTIERRLIRGEGPFLSVPSARLPPVQCASPQPRRLLSLRVQQVQAEPII